MVAECAGEFLDQNRNVDGDVERDEEEESEAFDAKHRSTKVQADLRQPASPEEYQSRYLDRHDSRCVGGRFPASAREHVPAEFALKQDYQKNEPHD